MKKSLIIPTAVLSLLAISAAAQSPLPTWDIPPVPTVQWIPSFEDEYFQKNGKYLQVLVGNTVPSDIKGIGTSTLSQIEENVPPGARIDVYESPQGHGYVISYTQDGTFYSVGYGPEAQDRTYSYFIGDMSVATSTATSTPQGGNATSTSATSTTSLPVSSF
jgi:hypothetical protein